MDKETAMRNLKSNCIQVLYSLWNGLFSSLLWMISVWCAPRHLVRMGLLVQGSLSVIEELKEAIDELTCGPGGPPAPLIPSWPLGPGKPIEPGNKHHRQTGEIYLLWIWLWIRFYCLLVHLQLESGVVLTFHPIFTWLSWFTCRFRMAVNYLTDRAHLSFLTW